MPRRRQARSHAFPSRALLFFQYVGFLVRGALRHSSPVPISTTPGLIPQLLSGCLHSQLLRSGRVVCKENAWGPSEKLPGQVPFKNELK